jgi:hypothetical protein
VEVEVEVRGIQGGDIGGSGEGRRKKSEGRREKRQELLRQRRRGEGGEGTAEGGRSVLMVLVLARGEDRAIIHEGEGPAVVMLVRTEERQTSE